MALEEQSNRSVWSRTTNTASQTFNAAQERPIAWLAPVLAFILIFRLYPLIEAVRISFTNMGFLTSTYEYVWLESYIEILTASSFVHMVEITALFVSVSIVGQLVFGLVLALAIDYGVRKALPGSISTRVSVLAAWVIPGIVIGILWQIMLIGARYGVVNYILLQVGLNDPISFLASPSMALASVTTANIWRGTAFSMIMLYGGLQQVPEQLHEAARVDGANALQRFRYITIPQLKPVLFINVTLITIYTMNTFDMIMSLTGGGPGQATEVLALYMYFEAFTRYNLGQAAALAVMMLLVNVVMVTIYTKYLIDEEEF